jgi:DNA-directed RNA polymerase II subunit RPB1
MYPSSIRSVKFSVIPSQVEFSNIIVKTRDLMKSGKPAPDGVYSAKQGTTSKAYKCETCFNDKNKCMGHSAIIELPSPVLNPTTLNTDFKVWIRIVCFKCGNALMSNEELAIIPINQRISKILARVKAKTVAPKICPFCLAPHPKVINDKEVSNRVKYGNKKKILLPHKISKVFSRVSDELVLKLGRPLSSHPINFIRPFIIVTPIQMRSEIVKTGSVAKSAVDEHTSMYQLLVERKDDLIVDGKIGLKKQTQILAYNEIYYNLLKGKENNSISARYMGKKGLFRSHMEGKRINVCCRAVIANSTDIKIDELGIPFKIAKTIQMIEIVQPYNYDTLVSYVMNGIKGYPGASMVVKKGKSHTITDDLNITLEIGDKVYRDLIDGDSTPFCRQPSLMISNIASHKAVVLRNTKSRSYLMNALICAYYNADFDGDEMNQFICSSILGRNESQKLQSVPNWVINSTSSNPLIGQMEDSIVGLAKLTNENVRLDKYHASMLFRKTSILPDLSFMKEGDVISGWDIITLLLAETPITFSRGTYWYVESYKNWINYSDNDKRVVIVNGVMKQGILDWASVGKGNNGSIYHIIVGEYGEVKMLEVMYNMQQVAISYLMQVGASIGLIDMVLKPEVKLDINLLCADIINRANIITEQLELGNIIPPIGETVESFYEKQIIEILTITDIFYPTVLSSIDAENNGLFNMIGYKSKGKISDMFGMMCAVGQRSINGKRITQNFGYMRTMPYAPRFSTNPYDRGYIGSAYVDGINKKEYLFAAQQVRFDLIVKALSTSVTGDQNRQSVKNLEPIFTNNFRWSVKHNTIVQLAYGEDYLDPRKLIKVKFNSILIATAELKRIYYNEKFPKFYDDIVLDRETYREAYLKIEKINIREVINDIKDVPVDISRQLNANIAKYVDIAKPSKNDTLEVMMDTIEQFIKNIPYIMMNDRQRIAGSTIPNFIKSSVFLFIMLCRISLHPNLIEKLLLEKKINLKVLQITLGRIFIKYLEALIDSGTAIGIIAAQCFSEPLTQYMLDAHTRSQAGGTSKSSMNNVKEVLGARTTDRLSAPVMILPVLDEYSADKARVQFIANKIEMIKFGRFISSHQLFLEKFGEPIHSKYILERSMIDEFIKLNPLLKVPVDLLKRCLRFTLDKTMLILKNISMEIIIRKIYENYPDVFIVYTPENTDNLVIRIYFRNIMFKEGATLVELRKVRNKMMDTIIRGVNGILDTEVIKLIRSQILEDGSIVPNTNCWGIKTLGTNLAELLSFPDIDHYNIQTTAIIEIETILGIAASRYRIIIELNNLGMSCSIRHLMIYADEMTSTGIITSIERYGLKAREPKNVLLRMGFNAPIATLEEAAVNNTVDELSGITSSLLVGTTPKIGTTYNQICFNEEFIRENTKSAESMLEALF